MGSGLKNYRMLIQYEGTRYKGWQKQESTDNTIQGKLENILSRMTGTEVEVHGSGRTDAGVHALGQVCNTHLETPMTLDEIMNYVNFYLPEDIAVIDIQEVDDKFHARLHAKSKTYLYRVLNSPIPHVFDRRYVYEYPAKLNVDAMVEAASKLVGTHDFLPFCTKKKFKKSTVRTITEIEIDQIGDEVVFTFSGDGFLYHMVRIMTGTLLEVGTGEKKVEDIDKIFAFRLRENAGHLVPAKGLALMEVRY